MEVKKTVEKALAKPMDRREFLGRAGMLVLSVVGVTAMLRSLRESTSDAPGRSQSSYGTSTYGDRRKS